jgi:hypothetical protein
MARSHQCFFGPDRSYNEARRRFVHKRGLPSAATRAATVGPPLTRAA